MWISRKYWELINLPNLFLETTITVEKIIIVSMGMVIVFVVMLFFKSKKKLKMLTIHNPALL
ncbi:hypothetical protein COT82_02185 [Candidatus Campbellbacteria bacterium CG10_big_fil_rev_8_21_14_0_10_35_52]|uniref:Uncharacterized protein n=1 Tax=Candidatus Campbellbacteria bacterium CG10_big_fil_rev_8_21_14_0_10_35_52 TaxID=1974527 RepID=A0A2M6WV04_9BACT|nr:MAG: hypothetical protein COT82_02185 [Candidatus Campbellbacteria bacterium CG10_big_fil_rev_8_21_14_0_10_35_52]